MAAKHFDVLSPMEFLSDIEQEAKHAKTRIWAQAMEVEPGIHASRLLNLVEKASEDGLDARLNIDYYSLAVTDGLPNILPIVVSGKWRKRLRIRKEAFQTIKNKGASLAFINKPTLLERLIYTMGRNHMKIFIIDDISWIGGVNFADGYFKRQDIMVKVMDKAIVEPIARVFTEVHEGKLQYDEMLQTKHNATLFIDCGHTRKSVILNAAVEMVEKAEKKVQVATAFIPDGKFLEAMIAASKRGVTVELVTSEPKRTIGVYRLINEIGNLHMKMKGVNFKIFYERNPVHAKLLLVDEKMAFFGSHNFLTKGVLMRTGELALQSSDRHLIANLSDFYNSITLPKT